MLLLLPPTYAKVPVRVVKAVRNVGVSPPGYPVVLGELAGPLRLVKELVGGWVGECVRGGTGGQEGEGTYQGEVECLVVVVLFTRDHFLVLDLLRDAAGLLWARGRSSSSSAFHQGGAIAAASRPAGQEEGGTEAQGQPSSPPPPRRPSSSYSFSSFSSSSCSSSSHAWCCCWGTVPPGGNPRCRLGRRRRLDVTVPLLLRAKGKVF